METLVNLYELHQDLIIQLTQNSLLTIVVFIVASIVSKIVRRGVHKAAEKLSGGDEIVSRLLSQVAYYAVYLVALVIILDLFGVNTASLVALLGAAGLAIGLALKDTLSNIAAGIMILFLKPIKKGEFVEFSSYSGKVTDIGLFTSVFETADGLYISSPNSVVWGSTIRNFSRNNKRRMDITIGISYKDSVEVGLEVLNKLASEQEAILKDPEPKVIVHMLADSSVNLQLRAWAPTDQYWDTYWAIQKQIKSRIEEAGLTIPFPQRDLNIKWTDEMPVKR
ncbi:mechanosensitive ion channel [Vibrio plantisponsor]|jgi:small conductance mechanosensitive channel|uniref:Small-conductance mechanosensitive channel n=1 Tax=Vibrio plantisponsor TaxID=664643 RepID=A0ABU4IM15_9VIBR|nr:mechanosensitive ion channel domain-containing protein [Vibrio plantisponsor]MDW6019283.1 mechanosensitive ion channel [Vibrio plantisponsor]NNM39389.1 mechanosensitive ion channel family protein [Vibrio plantisponsor]